MKSISDIEKMDLINSGKTVSVYYNLHRKCLSMRVKGVVVDHPHAVVLKNVKFRVQPAGRAKVLKEKRKNVHAFVCGQLVETYGEVLHTSPCVNGLWGSQPHQQQIFSPDFQVVYNPYRDKTFIKGSGESIFETYKYTLINNKEIWVGDWIPALTM
jgi:hypothetical protein